jgi:uncharacterized protein YbjT (DUF2867 family)
VNVLLTSATGYIGSAVAKALQTAGHQVIGIARSEASAQRLAASGIQLYRGDLTDAASLHQAAQMADAVIHTAATNDANMASVDRSAVETILAALEGTEKPFVYKRSPKRRWRSQSHLAAYLQRAELRRYFLSRGI